MPKVKLDATFILTARCREGAKKTDFWDTQIPGFVYEARASGGSTYYIRFSDQYGAQRQVKVARADQITFDQARRAARRLLSEVALGGNPAEAKAQKRAIPTYSELADQHVAHARTHMKSIKTLEGYMKRIRSRWGKLRLAEIQQRDVAVWLAELPGEGLAPATIEKTRVTFNRSFELGMRWGIPGCDKNPVRGVTLPRFNNARSRYADSVEVARLMAAAAKSRNTQLPAIVGLLLFTGARVSELLSARWKDVDTDRQAWFIPMSKTGRSRHVPLSQAAIDIIAAIPRKDDAIFLFPNPKDGKKHLTTIKHAWQTAREEAGLADLRIHDLRHSAASFMINSGIDLFTVGRVLGHASYQSTQRYSHLANDTLLAAVEAGAAKLKGDRAA